MSVRVQPARAKAVNPTTAIILVIFIYILSFYLNLFNNNDKPSVANSAKSQAYRSKPKFLPALQFSEFSFGY